MIAACPLCCYIRLTKGMISMVDPWFWVRVKRFQFRAIKQRGGWYAQQKIQAYPKDKYAYMHRLVMGSPRGMEVHHKNRNTLDNREENLEIVDAGTHRRRERAARITKYCEPKPEPGCCDLPMV